MWEEESGKSVLGRGRSKGVGSEVRNSKHIGGRACRLGGRACRVPGEAGDQDFTTEGCRDARKRVGSRTNRVLVSALARMMSPLPEMGQAGGLGDW